MCTPEIHHSPCRSLSIMPSLKRNEFIDDASSNLLSKGCGCLSACLSSWEIHVFASSIFRWMNDDIDTSDVGGKFLLRSCMCCLTDILVIYPTYVCGSLHIYVVLKTTTHGLSWTLTLQCIVHYNMHAVDLVILSLRDLCVKLFASHIHLIYICPISSWQL